MNLVSLEETKKPLEDVTDFSVLPSITEEMFKIMEEKKGVGLAAPQVGIYQKFFIMKLGKEKYVVVNPTIKVVGKMFTYFREGCLTVPGLYRQVLRHSSLVVEGKDENGVDFKWNCKHFMAQVVQHEFDHLLGRCIADTEKPHGT
jgi:peptide deformylase